MATVVCNKLWSLENIMELLDQKRAHLYTDNWNNQIKKDCYG